MDEVYYKNNNIQAKIDPYIIFLAYFLQLTKQNINSNNNQRKNWEMDENKHSSKCK